LALRASARRAGSREGSRPHLISAPDGNGALALRGGGWACHGGEGETSAWGGLFRKAGYSWTRRHVLVRARGTRPSRADQAVRPTSILRGQGFGMAKGLEWRRVCV